MNKEDLLNLINDDDLGLLTVKSKSSASVTSDDRLLSSFVEINNFIQDNNREPELGGSIHEHQLASRLKSLREQKEKAHTLLDYDEYDLLSVEQKEIHSMDDIFSDDDMGVLDSTDPSLFELKSVPANKNRVSADFVARRRPCKDFDKFEPLFQNCQKDLAAGKRKLIKFSSEKQVKEKSFFVLNGVLLYIDMIGETHLNKFGKINGRQRCIFENGTESEMLVRSLVQRLYEGGHAVTANSDELESEFKRSFSSITDKDNQTGYIYIVKSLSENPRLKSLDNLYKIGFSAIEVEERVKNAAQEPTYLMAPVKIITTFECYNFNPQKLEQLLHNFFGSACLNIDIFDGNNKRFTPREWFVAPLEIIEESVRLIINGGIVNYHYDVQNQRIVYR